MGTEQNEAINYVGLEFYPIYEGYTPTPEANTLILKAKPGVHITLEELARLENISYTEVFGSGRNCLFIQTFGTEGEEEEGVLVPEINGGIKINWVPALNTEGELILVPAISTLPGESPNSNNYIVASKLLIWLGNPINTLHTKIAELVLSKNTPTIDGNGVGFDTVICTREELEELKGLMNQYMKPSYIN